MTFFFKETHSDQFFFYRFAVCIDPLVASANRVLRYAADIVKMVRIIVNIYIPKKQKSLSCLLLSLLLLQRPISEPVFVAQFRLFCCRWRFLMKISDFSSESSWFRNCYSDFALIERFLEIVDSEFFSESEKFRVCSELSLIKYWKP